MATRREKLDLLPPQDRVLLHSSRVAVWARIADLLLEAALLYDAVLPHDAKDSTDAFAADLRACQEFADAQELQA